MLVGFRRNFRNNRAFKTCTDNPATCIELNDNMRMVLRAKKPTRRNPDRQLDFAILRATPAAVDSESDTLNYTTIVSGNFDNPSAKLLDATLGHIKAKAELAREESLAVERPSSVLRIETSTVEEPGAEESLQFHQEGKENDPSARNGQQRRSKSTCHYRERILFRNGEAEGLNASAMLNRTETLDNAAEGAGDYDSTLPAVRLRSIAKSESTQSPYGKRTGRMRKQQRVSSRSVGRTRSTISDDSRKKLKRTMMTIFERYNILPKRDKPAIADSELITTDELFKKMHIMLAPNKSNWIQYLKRDISTRGTDFLEKMRMLDHEVEEERRQHEKSVRATVLKQITQSRRRSDALLHRKLSMAKRDALDRALGRNNGDGDEDPTFSSGATRQRSVSIYLSKVKASTLKNNRTPQRGQEPEPLSKIFSLKLHAIQPARMGSKERIESRRRAPTMLAPEETPEKRQRKAVIKELIKEALRKKSNPQTDQHDPKQEALTQKRILWTNRGE